MAVRELPFPQKFHQSMAAWMVNKGMILGHLPEDLNADETASVLKIAASLFSTLGSLTPFIITGGKAKAEKVKQALAPFNELSDLVGVNLPQKVTDTGPYMVMVIYGDELGSKDIVERFDLFIKFAPSVANLGLRLNFQNMGIFIFPLVIFFDAQKYAKRAPKILVRGWRQLFWKKITLRAGTVNVGEKKIEWAEMKGISKSAATAWQKLGVKGAFSKFEPDDLHLVTQLATQLMKEDLRSPK